MDIKRGEVYWWKCPEHNRPHLLKKTRPVVIVSNDVCNAVSSVITVAPMTSQAKKPYPVEVPVVFNGDFSIVLLDKLTSIPVEELGYKVGALKDFQMVEVDRAMKIQLGLEPIPKEGAVCHSS